MLGGIYEMETDCGRIYLHHVAKSATFGDVVAVHRRNNPPATADELASETFAILFPISATRKPGVCRKVATAPIPPKYELDRFRYPFHASDGRLLYWVLVEDGKERRDIKSLTPEQICFPIAVAVNDTALAALVCAGYDADTIQFR
jgi:hypothetical protein